MQLGRLAFIVGSFVALAACSRSAPSKLVYSHREFSKCAEQAIPAAVVYVYTPEGVNQASADEHLNLIRQTSGVSDVPQVLPLVSDALERSGYVTSVVGSRDDALCSRRMIPEGAERLVTLVAVRGERTVQLQHVARDRAGNGIDATCAGATEVADLLELTLTSIP